MKKSLPSGLAVFILHPSSFLLFRTMTKIITIVGVTGNQVGVRPYDHPQINQCKADMIQGSSVAHVFLNEPGWKVRGITRDPSKPSATKWSSQGVEVVAGNLDDPKSLEEAFQGANVIFGGTDFWQHLNDPATHEVATEQNRTPNEVAYDREVAQAKAIIDAVARNVDNLDRFVLSTLSEARKWSGGLIKWNLHFDAKAEATNYLKATYPDLWAKTSLLQLGYYANNWKSSSGTPVKQQDGSFVVSLPISGDRKIPMTDPVADTGKPHVASI
jgi:hypothetical protein